MPLRDFFSGPSYGTINNMEQPPPEDEGDQLLQAGHESDGHGSITTGDDDSVQEGVRKIEAINMTWTTRSLVVAYMRLVS